MRKKTTLELLTALTFLTPLFGCGTSEESDNHDNNADDMSAATQDMGSDMPSSEEDMSGGEPDMGEAEDMSSAEDMPPAEDMTTAEDMSSEVDMMTPEDMGGVSGEPLPGFGELMGDCDVLDTELTDTQTHFFRNTLDFQMDAYDMSDFMLLSMGGQEIIEDGNAGGSSLLSEVFAYEVLYRCEDAVLLKTETEVAYTNPMGKITDLLVEIDGEKVGVSVVRAFAFPFEDLYPIEEATRILDKKLSDIGESTANVAAEDRWSKQILSVIAYKQQHADQIRAAYDQLDASLKADTILYVTATEGEDRPLYFND